METVHLIEEFLDGVLLFQLVEAYNSLLPVFVVLFKFLLIRDHNRFIILVALFVFISILGGVVLLEFNHQVFNHWFQ